MLRQEERSVCRFNSASTSGLFYCFGSHICKCINYFHGIISSAAACLQVFLKESLIWFLRSLCQTNLLMGDICEDRTASYRLHPSLKGQLHQFYTLVNNVLIKLSLQGESCCIEYTQAAVSRLLWLQRKLHVIAMSLSG